MSTEPSLPISPDVPVAAPPKARSLFVQTFIGPQGLRAGWKFLLFVVMLQVFMYATRPIRRMLPRMDPSAMSAGTVAAQDFAQFFALVLTTLFMAYLIDRKPWKTYGLPLNRAFRSTFWVGVLLGFGVLALQLTIMYAGGWVEFGPLQLHGAAILKMGAWWALAFLAVALFEEFLFRGYVQQALSQGMGFWGAAIVTAGLFALAHTGNRGENWFGIVMVFLDGILMCFTLWKTGDLWLAVGQHTAWNWTQTFFFGTANSGTTSVGVLRSPSFNGHPLLTGGTAGPEGSILVLFSLAVTAAAVALIYRKRPEPREAAVSPAAYVSGS